MKPKNLYMVLCVAGATDLIGEEMLKEQAEIEASAVVLWAFVFIEGRRAGMKHLWTPIAASLAVGVSLGLPLFLYMREHQLGRSAGAGARSGV